MSQTCQKSKNIPAFLQKLYNLLEDGKNQCAIMWSSNGVGFTILNEEILTKHVLPNYFKHSNYSSFIRQLNMYDFHKIRKGNFQNYFHHDKFIRGNLYSVSQIKRKPEKKKTLKNITNKNLNQIQRLYSDSEISQQKIPQKKVTNKTQITLNSVHTIKAKSEESIILMRENVYAHSKDQIYFQERDQNDRNRFSKINLSQRYSFENQEEMDDDSSKMSINNQLQSKTLIQHHQNQILVPSLNNIFTFINPYQLANFGLFL